MRLDDALATIQNLGRVWTQPTNLQELVLNNRIRIAGTDNALLVEIDGETWTLPDAFRLNNFLAQGR